MVKDFWERTNAEPREVEYLGRGRRVGRRGTEESNITRVHILKAHDIL